MGFLLRLYVNALFKGNPVVVLVTVVAAVALAAGPFYQALTSGDPVALGLAVFTALGLLFVLAVAIVDRKNNPPEGKRRGTSRTSRR